MSTCVSGLTQVSKETINSSLRNFEALVEQADVAYKLACDRYVADHEGKMFTGMLWWKKPVTERDKILGDNCDFYGGDYNTPSEKLIAEGYATCDEIILGNKVTFVYDGNIKDTYHNLYALVKASEGKIFVSDAMAKFINKYK
jgi:hypothetical protein